jgi:hypothetical protein
MPDPSFHHSRLRRSADLHQALRFSPRAHRRPRYARCSAAGGPPDDAFGRKPTRRCSSRGRLHAGGWTSLPSLDGIRALRRWPRIETDGRRPAECHVRRPDRRLAGSGDHPRRRLGRASLRGRSAAGAALTRLERGRSFSPLASSWESGRSDEVLIWTYSEAKKLGTNVGT